MKRREQEEEDTVTLEELEKQRVEALTILEKEREIVEQERAVYKCIPDKISKRHTLHHYKLVKAPLRVLYGNYFVRGVVEMVIQHESKTSVVLASRPSSRPQ